MARPFRQQIDEGILDRAAALFARQGFAKTSIQDIADAVGLSKAGLLHHFPSKDALREAVIAQVATVADRVLDTVRHLPAGPDRDRCAVEFVVDAALAHPGLVALLIAPMTRGDGGALTDGAAPEAAVLEAFGVDLETTGPERVVRVLGALGALAVLTLAAHDQDQTTAWRAHLAATCFDALGHGRSAALPSSDQVEA
ncbi:TetR/AcrR family transcriptional regulator [Blastococcus sp. LR1]|uniref:TetR/AcrR family transcriptional regulator n=1 Tax=Blastococcus sp. LR1 TaxID=2877000 RepID=UPI001CCAC098|nr:TetR/AcrR family transcriptional regulator [Blastococcus sp. LR1]MCA0144541.1 TetR/AcrR family transcriptional regulator; helix-turn-helix transcriptional regulator [Blastococcus sp. LR1]